MRIVLWGNFGAGNLGNECTLQTAIEEIRRRVPEAELLCLCTNPQDVRTRHGIAAYCSESKQPSWAFPVLHSPKPATHRPPDSQPAPSAPSPVPAADSGARSQQPAAVRSRRGVLARELRILFKRLPQELWHWFVMWRILRRSDMFVVPGTGIVTDHGCGPLGWPYDMFKLSLLARLCGTRVIYLSVGVGPIDRPLGAWLIKQALRLGHYRSYRDESSRRLMQAIGLNAAQDAVYPDLVFGLARAHLSPPTPVVSHASVIGLGLKDYTGSRNSEAGVAYRRYLSDMATFVLWLQEQGYVVRLLIGDVQYDTQVREEFIATLRARGAARTQVTVLADPIPSVTALLGQLAEADVVISPRFHNLVLALLLNKPVVALSDLPKVDALLSDLGLATYCMPLEGLSPAQVITRFTALQAEATRLKSYIPAQVERYRTALESQYRHVFG